MRCLVVALVLLSACVERSKTTELSPKDAIALAEKVRKLKRNAPIRATWIDQSDVRAHIDGLISADDRRATDAFGAALKDLGIDVGTRPLTEQLLDGMGQQVAGFYDPMVKTLYGVRRPTSFALETTTVLVHEGVHALQDQQGWLSTEATVPGMDDIEAAKQAMVEGDATIAMVAAIGVLQGQSEAEIGQNLAAAAIAIGSAISGIVDQTKLPPVVGEALAFPYAAGFTYLLLGRMRDAGPASPWAAVDKELSHPPLSTELVLHPSKHDDPPVFVGFDVARELPAEAGMDWERLPLAVLGERWHRFVFTQLHQDLRAASGWGGDLVMHYRERRSGDTVTVLGSMWDSAKDADEAEAAWRATGLDVVREANRVVVVGGRGNRTLVPGAVGRAALRTWRQQPIRSRAEGLAFLRGE